MFATLLDAKLMKLRDAYVRLGAEVNYQKEPPAPLDEVCALEQTLGLPLPESLKQTLLVFSKNFLFTASLPDAFSLPNELRGLFSATISLSSKAILNAEESRKGWTTNVFPDPNDEYDKVWHNKLGFMDVDNGDVVAFDLEDPSADKRVVYCSHDDGEGHGYTLGKNFGEFLDNLLAVGGCGLEDWQLLPFINGPEKGIDPDCRNAKQFRERINLTW